MTTGRVFLVLSLMLALANAPAHSSDKTDCTTLGQRTYVGIYTGVSFSHFTGPSSAPWDSRYGPVFGAYATYTMTDILALQMEIVRNSKGAVQEKRLSGDGSTFIPEGGIKLNYVQWVVLARVNPPMNRYEEKFSFRPKILVGFALGIRTKTKLSGSVSEANLHFQDTEISLIFGGGFDHRIGRDRRITLDFRYDLGMSYIYADWKNNAASLLVGFAM